MDTSITIDNPDIALELTGQSKQANGAIKETEITEEINKSNDITEVPPTINIIQEITLVNGNEKSNETTKVPSKITITNTTEETEISDQPEQTADIVETTSTNIIKNRFQEKEISNQSYQLNSTTEILRKIMTNNSIAETETINQVDPPNNNSEFPNSTQTLNIDQLITLKSPTKRKRRGNRNREENILNIFPSLNLGKSLTILNSILIRIHTFHSQTIFKSNILSLVAGLFSRTQLVDLGFEFSNYQYTEAKKIALDKKYIEYQSHQSNKIKKKKDTLKNVAEIIDRLDIEKIIKLIEGVVDRVYQFHCQCKMIFKASFLALLADSFKRNQLNQLGFEFSNAQYTQAKKIQAEKEFVFEIEIKQNKEKKLLLNKRENSSMNKEASFGLDVDSDDTLNKKQKIENCLFKKLVLLKYSNSVREYNSVVNDNNYNVITPMILTSNNDNRNNINSTNTSTTIINNENNNKNQSNSIVSSNNDIITTDVITNNNNNSNNNNNNNNEIISTINNINIINTSLHQQR
ncbi:hypothetical protein K502DRAFT_352990 [Neoconidiobolus thromboides FSU 785]|nr:hypothetical protein K502DRAFT_352990 [Neoconidiobolus thromboides FSU 785]